MGVPAATGRGVATTAALVVISAWAILTGLLILVGEGITHSSAVMSMDRSVTAFAVAHRTAALDQLMKAVTWAGSWITLLGLAVLVAVLAWRRCLRVSAVVAVLVAWWGELLAVTLTKAVVQRPRPPEALWVVTAHGWAFPSGHTANATVVFAAGAGLMTIFVSKRAWRVLAWALAVLATALVGFSRIELGVHWTTDVLASLVWTICWLLALVRVLRPTRPTRVAERQS
jgi:undecaprenyl-diphosphatase